MVPDGAALVAEFTAALERVSKESGRQLEFTEHERLALRMAAAAADRRAELQRLYDAEGAGEARPTILTKLSAELRLLDRATSDYVSRVQLGVGPAKSDRHQRAVNARWARRDAEWEAARRG